MRTFTFIKSLRTIILIRWLFFAIPIISFDNALSFTFTNIYCFMSKKCWLFMITKHLFITHIITLSLYHNIRLWKLTNCSILKLINFFMCEFNWFSSTTTSFWNLWFWICHFTYFAIEDNWINNHFILFFDIEATWWKVTL